MGFPKLLVEGKPQKNWRNINKFTNKFYKIWVMDSR